MKLIAQNFLRTMLSKKSFIYYLLLVFIICLPDLYFFISNKQNGTAMRCFVVTSSLFLMPVFLFRNNVKLLAKLLFPIMLLVPATLICIIFYNVPINDSIVLLIINTSKGESFELLKSYLLPALIIICSCLGSYFIIITKTPSKISYKSSAFISAFAVIIMLVLSFYKNDQATYFKTLKARYYTAFPTSIVYAAGVVYQQYELMHTSKTERDAFTFNAKQQPPIKQKQIYILVLGESVRYDHLGINGYQRNTTPKLQTEQNLISFADVNTNAFITEYSVPLIITGINPDNFKQHYQQKSIVSAYNEAGFATYWVSSQIDNGHIKIHLNESENKDLQLSDFKATKNITNDSDLLVELQKILDKPGEKKFIVLHGLGSHYAYSARYPLAYNVFKPSNTDRFSRPNDFKSKELIVNSYDNSILYTDNILDSAISLVKLQNAASSLFYISDHGENLFDDNRHLSQHGYPIPSKYIAHVPFFIWYSDTLEALAPEKIEILKNNRLKKASSLNVFYTHLGLSNITFNKQDNTKNLCSPQFKETFRVMLGGGFVVCNSDSLQ